MTSRSIMELLSAKSEGIKTIFFQNGTDFEFFSLHYFINNPKAPYLNQISLDEYYVFNKYWQSSYISKGKVFNYKNTIVSGYLRDQRKSDNNPFLLDLNRKSKTLKLPILIIIENEIPYKEILPYTEKLLKEGFLLEFKLRPQQKDAGDNIFNTMYSELISKGYSPKQITFNDLVFENINTNKYLCGIASYSTALLDCLIKGLDVFILGTNTWGDCFNLREYPSVKEIYCENSSILVERIQRIKEYGAEQKALYELLVPIYNPKFIENFVKDL